jgi:hypothetical protein
MCIAVDQQVIMIANYRRSQLMMTQGQSCNCNAGLRISGAELPWKGAKPEICNAHVFSLHALRASALRGFTSVLLATGRCT